MLLIFRAADLQTEHNSVHIFPTLSHYFIKGTYVIPWAILSFSTLQVQELQLMLAVFSAVDKTGVIQHYYSE